MTYLCYPGSQGPKPSGCDRRREAGKATWRIKYKRNQEAEKAWKPLPTLASDNRGCSRKAQNIQSWMPCKCQVKDHAIPGSVVISICFSPSSLPRPILQGILFFLINCSISSQVYLIYFYAVRYTTLNTWAGSKACLQQGHSWYIPSPLTGHTGRLGIPKWRIKLEHSPGECTPCDYQRKCRFSHPMRSKH